MRWSYNIDAISRYWGDLTKITALWLPNRAATLVVPLLSYFIHNSIFHKIKSMNFSFVVPRFLPSYFVSTLAILATFNNSYKFRKKCWLRVIYSVIMTHNYPLVTYNNLLCSIGINYEYLTHRLGGMEYKFHWLAAELEIVLSLV